MILDSLKNSALYYGVSPRMKQAFELIASTDWTTMEPGIHELDGKDIYVNVMERELKQKPDAKLEIHNEYIDIQVLIRGEEESFGWSERRELKKPLGEFSVENDIQLFDDVPQTYYTMRPGQFTVLFPEDGHAPMVGEGTVRKIIVKVRRYTQSIPSGPGFPGLFCARPAGLHGRSGAENGFVRPPAGNELKENRRELACLPDLY